MRIDFCCSVVLMAIFGLSMRLIQKKIDINKLHSWCKENCACLPVDHHCSSALLCCSLAIQLSRKAHEDSDYNTMITIIHWHLYAKTYPVCEVVGTVKKKACLLLTAIACSIQAAWSSCVMCVNWNEVLASRLGQHLNGDWRQAGGCKQNLPRYPQG